MKKPLIVLLFLLIGNLIMVYILLNLISIPFYDSGTYHDYEYSLIIDDEGDELEIQWQYTILNHSLINKLTNETYFNLDLESYNQGDLIFWVLSLTEDDGYKRCDNDAYWEVLRDEYILIGGAENYKSSHRYRIRKYAGDYLRNLFKTDNYYTNRLIPIDVGDFLSSMKSRLEYSSTFYSSYSVNYEIEANSIIKHLRNKTEFIETFSYNYDGILKYDVISYENQTVMELRLVKYDLHKYDPTISNIYYYLFIYRLLNLIFVSSLISIIIVIIAISMSDDNHNKNSIEQKKSLKLNDNQQKKGKNQINRNQKLLKNSGKHLNSNHLNNQLCSNCTTLLKDKAIFCHNCGVKVNNEIKYCQYCGRINKKTANYCHECGHKF